MRQVKCIIFGSIAKVKGYERAIAVAEKNPRIHLTIAGPLWNPAEKPVAYWLKKKGNGMKNLSVEIR